MFEFTLLFILRKYCTKILLSVCEQNTYWITFKLIKLIYSVVLLLFFQL